jgi:hypothetical protein
MKPLSSVTKESFKNSALLSLARILAQRLEWLRFLLDDLDLSLAWLDHGSMARSRPSGSDARFLKLEMDFGVGSQLSGSMA